MEKKKAVIKTLLFTPAEKKKQRSLSLLPQPVMCVLVHERAHLCVCWILNWRCGNSYVNDTQTHTVSCSITQRLLISSPWFISFTAAARPYVQLFFSFNKWTELPAVRFNHVVGEQKDEKIEKNKEAAQDERNM